MSLLHYHTIKSFLEDVTHEGDNSDNSELEQFILSRFYTYGDMSRRAEVANDLLIYLELNKDIIMESSDIFNTLSSLRRAFVGERESTDPSQRQLARALDMIKANLYSELTEKAVTAEARITLFRP